MRSRATGRPFPYLFPQLLLVIPDYLLVEGAAEVHGFRGVAIEPVREWKMEVVKIRSPILSFHLYITIYTWACK